VLRCDAACPPYPENPGAGGSYATIFIKQKNFTFAAANIQIILKKEYEK
jgi:hypothetical protein